ncbi:MAG: hypothetical protein ABT940_12580 [Alphaproteobacteria bacterium]
MRTTIENFRNVIRASLDLNGVVLVAGTNGAGKSSLAQAVAQGLSAPFLSAHPSSVPSMSPMARRKALVTVGATEARIVLSSETPPATRCLKWPSNEVVTDGQPPESSPHAVGLIHILDMEERERAKFLARSLDSEPSRDDFVQAATEAGVAPSEHQAAWTLVESLGFDQALGEVLAEGARLKGRWELVTGVRRYGAKLAACWEPEGWEASLAQASRSGLMAAITEAQTALEQAISERAVASVDRERLEIMASRPERALEPLLEAIENAKQERDAALQALATLPVETSVLGSVSCPHCGHASALMVEPETGTYRLVPTAESSPRGRKRGTKRPLPTFAEARARVDEALRRLATAEALALSTRQLNEARQAAILKLASLDTPEGKEMAVVAIEHHRAAYAQARRRLAMTEARDQAEGLRHRIETLALLATLLQPDGLRQSKLSRTLSDFQSTWLDPICREAGWPPVTLERTLTATLAGRSHEKLSTSEQYRVRVVLQMALARKEGAAAVVIDGADVLDAPGRIGLIRMLRRQGLPALVCLTTSHREEAVTFARITDIHNGYWLRDGRAEPLHPADSSLAAA